MAERPPACKGEPLPYGRQTIEDDDVAAVSEALRGAFLTTGPLVDRFDAAFAQATQARHAACCNSGTAALHLAMLALGIGPGDRVVVPSITFLASANAARYVGADVVFADVDPGTGLLRPEDLEAALRRSEGRAKAVMPVQLNGQSAEMGELSGIARRNGLHVVEDACHALGAKQATGTGEMPVGACALSDIACFSLHPVKAITTGEGGVATTNSPELAQRLRMFRSHGMVRPGTSEPWHYEMHEVGFNYRLPDVMCALGLSQLEKLGRFVARRQEIARLYDRLLESTAPLIRPAPRVPWSSHAFHLYVVHIDFRACGKTRAGVVGELRSLGIHTQVHYIPVHRQPYYAQRYHTPPLPGADAYYRSCLSIPIYPRLADADAADVVKALRAVVAA